jgi:hypothetical protein
MDHSHARPELQRYSEAFRAPELMQDCLKIQPSMRLSLNGQEMMITSNGLLKVDTEADKNSTSRSVALPKENTLQ